MTVMGSSPRVRGKLSAARIRLDRAGLIPARAGKTFGVVVSLMAGRAHPRACGENDVTPAADKGEAGSSPRVRGKHGDAAAHCLVVRLIPARAGKTS